MAENTKPKDTRAEAPDASAEGLGSEQGSVLSAQAAGRAWPSLLLPVGWPAGCGCRLHAHATQMKQSTAQHGGQQWNNAPTPHPRCCAGQMARLTSAVPPRRPAHPTGADSTKQSSWRGGSTHPRGSQPRLRPARLPHQTGWTGCPPPVERARQGAAWQPCHFGLGWGLGWEPRQRDGTGCPPPVQGSKLTEGQEPVGRTPRRR